MVEMLEVGMIKVWGIAPETEQGLRIWLAEAGAGMISVVVGLAAKGMTGRDWRDAVLVEVGALGRSIV